MRQLLDGALMVLVVIAAGAITPLEAAVSEKRAARDVSVEVDLLATSQDTIAGPVSEIFSDDFESGATGKWSNGTANYLVDTGSLDHYLDESGQTWLADEAWSGTGYGFEGGGTAEVIQPIDGTTEDGLYQTERWGTMTYHFDLPPAGYLVTLHFVELGFITANGRIFDVSMEGTLILDDLDLFVASGGRYIAYPLTFEIQVTDGTLDIGFVDVVDVSQISAIEIR